MILERAAGLPEEKLVEAHGSFVKARCIQCGKVSITYVTKFYITFNTKSIFNIILLVILHSEPYHVIIFFIKKSLSRLKMIEYRENHMNSGTPYAKDEGSS